MEYTFRLTYTPPYDWFVVRDFLAARLIPGVEHIWEQGYARTVRLNAVSGWFQLIHEPQDHAFVVHLHADGDITEHVAQQIRKLLDLDANMAEIHGVLGKDPLLASLLAQYPGTRLPGTWDPFEFSIRAVLGQQISVKAATTLAARIAHRYGEPMTGPEDLPLTHFFPTPASLHGKDFDGIGLTRTRTQTLINMVDAIATGKMILKIFDHNWEDFVQRFTALRGIGPWTAHYVGMRGLSWPDAFPESDLGILKALGHDGQKIKPKQALARAKPWRPWRAYAAMLLWRSLS